MDEPQVTATPVPWSMRNFLDEITHGPVPETSIHVLGEIVRREDIRRRMEIYLLNTPSAYSPVPSQNSLAFDGSTEDVHYPESPSTVVSSASTIRGSPIDIPTSSDVRQTQDIPSPLPTPIVPPPTIPTYRPLIGMYGYFLLLITRVVR